MSRRAWIPCDGRVLLVNEYPELFHVIACQWGHDGPGTFRVPDKRGDGHSIPVQVADDFKIGGHIPSVGDVAMHAWVIRAIPWPESGYPKPGEYELVTHRLADFNEIVKEKAAAKIKDMERECSTQLTDLGALHETERAADKAEIERLGKRLRDYEVHDETMNNILGIVTKERDNLLLALRESELSNRRADDELFTANNALASIAKELEAAKVKLDALQDQVIQGSGDLKHERAMREDAESKRVSYGPHMVIAHYRGADAPTRVHEEWADAEKEAIRIARKHVCKTSLVAVVKTYEGATVVTDCDGVRHD